MNENIVIQFGKDVLDKIKAPLFLTATLVFVSCQWQTIVIFFSIKFTNIEDKNLLQEKERINEVFELLESSFWDNALLTIHPLFGIEKDFSAEIIYIFTVALLVLASQYVFLFLAKKTKALYMRHALKIDAGRGGELSFRTLALEREIKRFERMDLSNQEEINRISEELRNVNGKYSKFHEIKKFLDDLGVNEEALNLAINQNDPRDLLLTILELKYGPVFQKVMGQFPMKKSINLSDFNEEEKEKIKEMAQAKILESEVQLPPDMETKKYLLSVVGSEILQWASDRQFLSQN